MVAFQTLLYNQGVLLSCFMAKHKSNNQGGISGSLKSSLSKLTGRVTLKAPSADLNKLSQSLLLPLKKPSQNLLPQLNVKSQRLPLQPNSQSQQQPLLQLSSPSLANHLPAHRKSFKAPIDLIPMLLLRVSSYSTIVWSSMEKSSEKSYLRVLYLFKETQ